MEKKGLNEMSRFNRMIREICAEEGIETESAAGSWAFCFRKGHASGFLYGYHFGLNSAAASEICNSKSTAAEFLALASVPVVPHDAVYPPAIRKFITGGWSLSEAEDLLERSGRLVLKNDTGTGGKEVFLVRTKEELKEAAEKLFSAGKTVTVSPYIAARREVRIVVLDGRARLMFSKERESVIGNGKDTLEELLRKSKGTGKETEPVKETELSKDTEPGMGKEPEKETDATDKSKDENNAPGIYPGSGNTEWKLSDVIPEGTVICRNWKHNLGQGAKPALLRKEDPKGDWDFLEKLALSASSALGIRFASVDVIEAEGGEMMVLEVNSGVMLEHFSGCSEEYYRIAKELYREAVLKTLEAGGN